MLCNEILVHASNPDLRARNLIATHQRWTFANILMRRSNRLQKTDLTQVDATAAVGGNREAAVAHAHGRGGGVARWVRDGCWRRRR